METNLKIGDEITVVAQIPTGELILKGKVLKESEIDLEGNYGEEGDLICYIEVYLENELAGESLEIYCYYDIESNSWLLFEGWDLN